MYSFGDTVLVPFPFTDQSGVKKRPAVVVSSREFQAKRRDLIIVAVTSRVSSGWADTPLSGWSVAGLLRPSVAKPILATIDRTLILRQLGALSRRDSLALRETLDRLIG